MQTSEQLEKAFDRIGYAPNTGKIALRTLANTLSSNERVLAVIEGASESTVGVLVATDLRVLFVGCSPLKDSVIRTVGYNEVSSIRHMETEFPCAEIEIQKSVETIKIIGCDAKQSVTFTDLVHELSEDRKNRSKDLDEINL